MSNDLEMIVTNNNLPLLAQMEELIRKNLHRTMRKIGVQLEAKARLHIQHQDLNWKALSDEWLAYKKKNGFSNQIYIMTSSYIQNITWQYTETDFKLDVGLMRSAMWINPENGHIEPLADIAFALEFGYDPKNIPKRPLWGPTLEESRRSISTQIGISVAKSVKQIADQAKGTIHE